MQTFQSYLILGLLLFGLTQGLTAQILITNTTPSGNEVLTVCNDAPFSVTVTNTGSDPLSNINATIRLAAGATYVPGSITTVIEQDIANLNAPIFTLNDLAPAATLTFTFRVKASCDLVDAINAGQLFTNEIIVRADGGISNNVFTDPYPIETPLIVFTNSTNLASAGREGEQIIRRFTIRNTRLGPLSEFVFKDSFDNGITISGSPGTDQSSAPNSFSLLLDGSVFQNIGDGDTLFELNEELTITETITITDCGQISQTSFSSIQACWGCDGEICQATTPIQAKVDILPSPIDTPLVFEPITDLPECFCIGETFAESGLRIINQSPADAINLGITLQQLSRESGLLPGSFRLDSAGISQSLTPTFDTLVQFIGTECDGLSDVFNFANITIPRLAAGDTLFISWSALFCEQVCVGQAQNSWSYSYVYTRDCPPNPVFRDDNVEVDSAKVKRSRIEFDGMSTIDDGEEKLYTYQIISDYLLSPSGNLTLSFDLPCGILWNDNNVLSLGGSAPIRQDITNTGNSTIIEATYALPLAADSLAIDFLIGLNCDSLCGDVCLPQISTSCVSTCPPISPYFFSVNAFFDLDAACSNDCELATCVSQVVNIPCMQEMCPADTIPGYVQYQADVFRINYGLPDNDNDRMADVGGSLNLDSIRTDRAMYGDTIRVQVAGEVVIDQPGTSFTNGFVSLGLNILQGGPDGNRLNSPTGLPIIAEQFRLYDQSEDQWYDCPDLNNLIRINVADGYLVEFSLGTADLATLNCGIPTDFVFDSGDSIRLSLDLRVNVNLGKSSPNVSTPPVGILVLTPNVYLYDTPNIAPDDLFSCGCSNVDFLISGITYDLFVGNYPVPPCEPSQYISGSFFRTFLAFENFFPYEFRSLGQLDDWTLSLPPDFSIAESRLLFLQRQNQDLLQSDQNLNLSPGPDNQWSATIDNLIDFPLDEGYIATFQYRFETDCSFTGNYPLSIEAGVTLPSNLAPLDTGNIVLDNPASLRMLNPRLSIDASLTNITSFDDQGRWNFSLINTPTVIASSESGAAPNLWIAPVNATGNLQNYRLRNTETNQTYPFVNGLFQLGDLGARDTISFQLIAQNTSCEEETLTLNFGWNCDPLLSPSTPACFSDTLRLSVISPPAELEQIVQSPSGPFDLCDTIAYHLVEVFNADLGTAYMVLVDAQLPAGLNIVPGSSEIAYPAGSPFLSIGDPIDQSGNIVRWDISQANDSIGLNGLPGTLNAPQDKFQLRFKTTTDCDFIAGASIVYVARAAQNCGLPTNTLAESGLPIDINGVSTPYNSSLNIQALNEPGCADEVRFRVQFSATGMTLNADSLLINLPPGITYLAGSFSPISNAPTAEPSLLNFGGAQQLVWQIPPGLSPGTTVSFEFSSIGYNALDCNTLLIVGQSVAPANALCATAGQSCSIQVETGNSLTRLTIDRPRFDFDQFLISTRPGPNGTVVDFQIDGRNNGTTAPLPLTIDLYEDSDQNGQINGGDPLLTTYNFTTALDSGGLFSISDSFLYSGNDFCQFLAVIDPNQFCQCQTDTIQVSRPIRSIQADTTVCSGLSTTIGLPSVPGTVYQWTPSTFLSCDTCATTNFSFNNNSLSTADFTLNLIAIDGFNCEIQYEFPVSVLPEPEILSPSDQICFGDSLTLNASAGQTFQWEGPGINDPNVQNPTVAPTQTSLYRVTVTNALGCVGSDSLQITVLPLPIANAGRDTAFCTGSIAQLNAENNPDYSYRWTPATLLSDPEIPNPLILGNSTTTFYLTVTNSNGCSATDSVIITLGFSPTVVPASTNETICFGDSIELAVSGANRYQWTPGMGLSCDTCSVVMASPDQTTTYSIIGSLQDGCADTTSILVRVNGGISEVNDQNICEGEEAIIFGDTINQTGLYCDTLQSILTGCDSLVCVDLEVLPEALSTDNVRLCEGETIEWNGITLSDPGLYCDTLASISGCDSITCLDLRFDDRPEIQIDSLITLVLGQDTMISLPDSFEYRWMPTEGLSCSDCSNPTISVESNTSYTVEVENEEGCIRILRVVIIVTIPPCDDPAIFVPNAFSPNGDSENDVFRVYGQAVEEMHLRVYNRWGQLVFESFDQEDTWDGRFKGKALAPDVFGYYLEALCVDGQTFRKKGNVTLLR